MVSDAFLQAFFARMVLYMTAVRLDSDSAKLCSYVRQKAFYQHIFAACSAIEEFVFFSPLSYQERLRQVV